MQMPKSLRGRCPARSWTGLFAAAGLLLLGAFAAAEESPPFFFIQLTDPQFGMYAGDANFAQEAANFEFAVATANRLKPAFVIVTGDLLNKAGDKAQANEYLRIAARLNGSIRLYHVPGNHDVGNEPTPESLAAYSARFGPNYYTFRHGNLLGVVLDTTLLRAPQRAPQAAEEQDAWLQQALNKELEKPQAERARHIAVFQHQAWFLKDAAEPDQYFNLPSASRRRYLDLLQHAGVRFVFAGHYHGNLLARDGTLEVVTSGPLGKPLRNDPSGLRIVIVRDSGLEHRYYSLGEIPNQIDLAVPK